MKPRAWTRETAVAAMQDLAREIGRTPTYAHVVAAAGRVPGMLIIRRLFGTLRNLQIAAGLEPNRTGPPLRTICRAELHPMTEGNIVFDHLGRRLCRACRCEKLRRQRKSNRRPPVRRVIPPDVAARHSPAALSAYWGVPFPSMERAS